MNVIDTTQRLVRIPSVNPSYDSTSPGESGMVRWLVDWARRHDIECIEEEVFPGRNNVIFCVENDANHPHLLLNGHTDTVAVDEMTIPPFGGELRDGRIWGRGSTDMKGPLACMLHALLRLRDSPKRWKGKVTLACVVDEEATFRGIRHLLQAGDSYDFAIVGEPTNHKVARGCKGCLRFFIRAHGRAAHSSTPEQGASAIAAMARAVCALENFFADDLAKIQHLVLGQSTGSIGLIQGGSGINIVSDLCEVQVDVRLVPGQSWEDTYTQIQKAAAIDLPGIRWEFDPNPLVDFPFCLEAEHPFTKEMLLATGQKQAEVFRASCDASKIVAGGIPCVVFGPGDVAEAHTPNESIPVKELERAVDSYVQIAETLLKR